MWDLIVSLRDHCLSFYFAWSFAARIGDKYQIRLTRPKYSLVFLSILQYFVINLNYVVIESIIVFKTWWSAFIWHALKIYSSKVLEAETGAEEIP